MWFMVCRWPQLLLRRGRLSTEYDGKIKLIKVCVFLNFRIQKLVQQHIGGDVEMSVVDTFMYRKFSWESGGERVEKIG